MMRIPSITLGLCAASLVLASMSLTSLVAASPQRGAMPVPRPAPRAMPARAASGRAQPARRLTTGRNLRRRTAFDPETGTASPGGGMGGCGRRAEPLSPEVLAARKFRQTRVTGRRLAKRVDLVRRELRWHKKLSSAVEAARAQKRPILWIQTLGSLSGYL